MPIIAPLLALFVLCANGAVDDLASRAFSQVATWMRQNGAIMNKNLHGNVTSHGGVSVRGVYTSTPLSTQALVMRIPSNLWLSLDNFPDFAGIDLSMVSSCSEDLKTRRVQNIMRLAVAIAYENNKGKDSFYFPYLQTLPTLDEFKSFDPNYAGAQLLSDFGVLPLFADVKKRRLEEDSYRKCFLSWQKSDGLLEGMAWSDVQLACAWLRTRAFGIHEDEPAIFPGVDLINTEVDSGPHSLNVVASVSQNAFDIRVKQGSRISAGGELFDEYCKDCDNSELMSEWGLYLEDNRHHVPKELDCVALAQEDIRRATAAALHNSAPGNFTAPRCSDYVPNLQDQGALRCSLARLAWEYCGEEWDNPSQWLSNVAGEDSAHTALALETNTSDTRNLLRRSKAAAQGFLSLLRGSVVVHPR